MSGKREFSTSPEFIDKTDLITFSLEMCRRDIATLFGMSNEWQQIYLTKKWKDLDHNKNK